MRPIKFRAWDKKNKKMVENYLSIHDLGNQMVQVQDGDGMVLECELMQFTGLLDKNGKEIYEGDIICCELDVRTGTRVVSGRRRGEFETFARHETRLSNGEIIWDKRGYLIKFNAFDDYDCYFFVSKRTDKPEHRHEQIIRSLADEQLLEVIGNIYEHPQLLNK